VSSNDDTAINATNLYQGSNNNPGIGPYKTTGPVPCVAMCDVIVEMRMQVSNKLLSHISCVTTK